MSYFERSEKGTVINEGTQQRVAALKPAAVPVGHQESAFVDVRNVGGLSNPNC